MLRLGKSAIALVGCSALGVLSGCGGSGQPTTGGGADSHQGADPQRAKNPPGCPYPDRLISGGKMLGAGAGFVSNAVMEPETSGWTVSSGSQNTIVVAGGDARHPSDGLFSILRTSYYVARQRINDVGVPGSGPVTITKAPLGCKIVESAQKHGEIEFKSKSGITGTLHLENDTVTLNR